ncbi:hypothetical protein KCU85_g3000, partial [Aureobasidium melanogenum]
MQPKVELQRRESSATTKTTLLSYDESLASGNPPAYQSDQSVKKPKPQEPTAGASAATIRAIMGDPIPEELRRTMISTLRSKLASHLDSYMLAAEYCHKLTICICSLAERDVTVA